MVGRGVLVYGIVFTLVVIFTIFPISITADAAIKELKFDQEKILEGHSDVITVIDSPAPSISIISNEDFESGFNTWTNTVGDDNDCWDLDSSGTPTGNTGPSAGAAATTFYVFYESSAGCSAEFDQAFLLGPTIDFDTFNSVQVQFSRHMWDGGAWNGDDMGRLALELEDSPGSGTFTEVWFQQGSQGNQWDLITIDLSSENGSGPRQLRFVATDITVGAQSDMAVDEITIQAVGV